MAEADHNPDATDVNVRVTKTNDGMSTRQWIAVIGLGTVLLPGIVGWMMYWMNQQTEFTQTTIQQNTAALTSVKDQGEDIEKALEGVEKVVQGSTRMMGRVLKKFPDEADEAEEASQ